MVRSLADRTFQPRSRCYLNRAGPPCDAKASTDYDILEKGTTPGVVAEQPPACKLGMEKTPHEDSRDLNNFG